MVSCWCAKEILLLVARYFLRGGATRVLSYPSLNYVPPDSVESAHREIAFFFPEFNVREWMERHEPFFRTGHVEYDQQRRIHTVLGTA